MTKEVRNSNREREGCPPRRTLRRFVFVFSAKGAAFIASPPQDGFAVANLGQRPRIGGKTNISAEGAIHFSPPELRMRAELIRAFIACLLRIQIPGAMPHADCDIAPLAPTTHSFAEWSRGDVSDIDGQPVWAREWNRTSQTPYNNCGFVINSSFVIRASSFWPS
jgi:hypothetical protein